MAEDGAAALRAVDSWLGGPPQTKAAYVVERLREEIAAGALPPGAQLRQTEIAARYGVSPTPVREALRLLEAAGTITYAPNRVATVREGTWPAEIHDLYLLRAEVEGFATYLGVDRMDDGLLERVRACQAELRAMEGRDRPREVAVLNRKLHVTIYEAGSHLVAEQVARLWEAFPPRTTTWKDPAAAAALAADHEQIIEAIEARDARLASELAKQHIMHAAEFRKIFP